MCNEDLFITPYVNSYYGVNIKKAIKISKSEIEEIKVNKNGFLDSKVFIILKNGKTLKFRIIENSNQYSWLDIAYDLELWSHTKIVKMKMTEGEAFLLDCRITAKQLILIDKSFTILELVNIVVNNENDAKEWIRIYGDKIYSSLKEDIKRGEIKAKIYLVKRGEVIVYEKIRFEPISK